MIDEVLFRSAFDGKEIQFPATADFKSHYRFFKGKCYSALCSNAAVVIHFSRTGRADRMYCYHEAYNSERMEGGRWLRSYSDFAPNFPNEMKVYIVYYGDPDFEEWHLVGAFESRDDAYAHIRDSVHEADKDNYHVSELDLIKHSQSNR